MKNEDLIGKWYLEMWNKWNTDIIPEIMVPEIAFRGSLGQEKTGYQGLKEYIDYIQSAFPDFHNEIELIITENNKSFAKLKYSGTHKGDLFGVQPTNRKITYNGCAVFTFENGKIKDVWVLGDKFGLMEQLK